MCEVIVLGRDGTVTSGKIKYLRFGKSRRALTQEDATQVFRLRQKRKQVELDELPPLTGVSGGTNHEQRITRCGYGQKEWVRKHRHDRARGCGCGDKSLRACKQARSRRSTFIN